VGKITKNIAYTHHICVAFTEFNKEIEQVIDIFINFAPESI